MDHGLQSNPGLVNCMFTTWLQTGTGSDAKSSPTTTGSGFHSPVIAVTLMQTFKCGVTQFQLDTFHVFDVAQTLVA